MTATTDRTTRNVRTMLYVHLSIYIDAHVQCMECVYVQFIAYVCMCVCMCVCMYYVCWVWLHGVEGKTEHL
jgi:hypothetical protein